MDELMNNLSSDNLVLLCVVMGVVALFLAIAISIEIYNSNKKYQKLMESEKNKKLENTSSKLNIKESPDIKYVDESDEELEKTKAKIELANLREKLRKEEEEKQKLLEMNMALAETQRQQMAKEALLAEKSKEEQEEVDTPSVNETVVIDNSYKVENIDNSSYVEDTEINDVHEENNIKEEVEVLEDLDSNPDDVVVLDDEEDSHDEIVVLEDNDDNHDQEQIEIEEVDNSKDLDVHDEVVVIDEDLHNDELVSVEESNKEQVIEEGNNTSNEIKIDEDSIKEEVKNAVMEKSKQLDEALKKVRVVNEIDEKVEEKKNEDDAIIDEYLKEYVDDEEDAIISYDELKNSQSFGYTDEEMANYVDEKDAVISIQELEKLYDESQNIDVQVEMTPEVEFEMKKVEDLPEIVDSNKFQSSPMISPVYGISQKDQDIVLEQTANLEKLNEEIKKTNEFLKTLKDLQKNLE